MTRPFRPAPIIHDCPHCNLTAQVMRHLVARWWVGGIDGKGE